MFLQARIFYHSNRWMLGLTKYKYQISSHYILTNENIIESDYVYILGDFHYDKYYHSYREAVQKLKKLYPKAKIDRKTPKVHGNDVIVFNLYN